MYNYDILRHGDAIEVENVNSAREVFRRWRRANDRPGTRLVQDRQKPNRLFFFDDDREEV